MTDKKNLRSYTGAAFNYEVAENRRSTKKRRAEVKRLEEGKVHTPINPTKRWTVESSKKQVLKKINRDLENTQRIKSNLKDYK